MAQGSRKASIPYLPYSRPTPEYLDPPQGACGSSVMLLITTRPARICDATRRARWGRSRGRRRGDHMPRGVSAAHHSHLLRITEVCLHMCRVVIDPSACKRVCFLDRQSRILRASCDHDAARVEREARFQKPPYMVVGWNRYARLIARPSAAPQISGLEQWIDLQAPAQRAPLESQGGFRSLSSTLPGHRVPTSR